jgi:hypothetical protein
MSWSITRRRSSVALRPICVVVPSTQCAGTVDACRAPMVTLRSLSLLAVAFAVACGSAESSNNKQNLASDHDDHGAPPAAGGVNAMGPPKDGCEDAGAGHDHGGGHGGGHGQPSTPLGPSCDEDNTAATVEGSIDRPLPEEIIQFERSLSWGCVHREWHEARQWDFIRAGNNPSIYADRIAYVEKTNWKRAEIQEGAPGSGFEFLAMHRAMVGTLADRFPEHAHLFSGWTSIPTESTADDPLVPNVAAFRETMKSAIARIESDLAGFPTEDELGNYLQTQHRPTPQDPLARSTDPTTGLHTYIHVRFDDPRSAIRMQRFSRNIESVTFFRLHGWIDRVWTKWRALKGLNDATDPAYAHQMHHACMHMGLGDWSVARGACVP